MSGHTHLPSDRDFALIEKRQRKYAPIVYSPEEWHKIIRESNKKKTPFEVTVMQQSDFLCFEPLLGNIKKALRTKDGGNVNFSGVFSFHFTSENTKVFTVTGEYKELYITKSGRPVDIALSSLKNKYTEPLKIPKKKLDNVRSLLPYIPPVHHAFYKKLKCAEGGDEEDENQEQAEVLD
jgi:hypothetical protein